MSLARSKLRPLKSFFFSLRLPRPTSPASHHGPARRLALERLEDRTVPSTAPAVTFLKDLTPGAPAGYADEGPPSGFVQVGRYVYFSNYFLNYVEGKYLWELWRTDGTPAGTEMVYGETYVAEVQPAPGNLTDVGNALYYTAPVPPRGETEPWRFDGTTGTPILVGTEFYQTQVVSYLTPVGNALYFTTSGTQQSQEIWKCVGTTVTQVYDNQYPFEILGVTAVDSDVYFFAPVGGVDTGNYHLFKYDGTTATDLTPATYVDAYEGTTVAGHSIYFFSAASPQQMLQYDGTSVTQVPLGSSVTADVNSLTAVGNTLYFHAVVDSQGDERLYKYDGTTLTPITAGTAVSSQFNTLQVVGNTVYFDAEIDSQGDEQLFAYPGTGTTATQVVAGTYSNPSPLSLTPVGDALYFSAQVDAAGDRQLFRYDGTTATEIPVGTLANPDPIFFTAIGNTVYFDAQVDSRGNQAAVGNVRHQRPRRRRARTERSLQSRRLDAHWKQPLREHAERYRPPEPVAGEDAADGPHRDGKRSGRYVFRPCLSRRRHGERRDQPGRRQPQADLPRRQLHRPAPEQRPDRRRDLHGRRLLRRQRRLRSGKRTGHLHH
jgi:ELWxxDGT repeat protein